jgi:hypothetical protein
LKKRRKRSIEKKEKERGKKLKKVSHEDRDENL